MVAGAAVEFGGVHVGDKGFAGGLSCLDTGGISHPVVGMDEVMRKMTGPFGRLTTITESFIDEVAAKDVGL